jgi:hypothetical protein
VLRRNQKARGRFYLFLLYEVNHGRVHWAFYPGKGAESVCRFPRRVRRWYPRQPMRIGLDRDPAHPIKARVTRRMMRQLRLHWTSMPKASPDENPVETIFSDIQQNILDNSDDPNERATQHRISSHLRARNRRSDRFIRIGYLEYSQKLGGKFAQGFCDATLNSMPYGDDATPPYSRMGLSGLHFGPIIELWLLHLLALPINDLRSIIRTGSYLIAAGGVVCSWLSD